MRVHATLLTTAAMIGPALAADPLQGFGDVPPVIPFVEAADPMADLSGGYVGGSVGYAFELYHGVVTTGTDPFLGLGAAVTPRDIEVESDGSFTAGLHAGVNVGVAEGFVIGGEVDFSIGDMSGEAAFTGGPILNVAGLRTSAEIDVEWLGTARARVGGMVFDDVLLYGTGGLAFGNVDVTGQVVAIDDASLAWTGDGNDLEVGYAIGGGAEYVITPNVSIRGEYLYYDLGKVDVLARGNDRVRSVADLNGVDYAAEADVNGHLLKAGLNVRLGSLF